MTTAATASDTATPDLSAQGVVTGTLKQGESATIFTGAQPATFYVSLYGTIRATAEIDVIVDDSVATTLRPNAKSTFASGKSIRVTSRGREPQTFLASPVD
jgi:hypothetical protein